MTPLDFVNTEDLITKHVRMIEAVRLLCRNNRYGIFNTTQNAETFYKISIRQFKEVSS